MEDTFFKLTASGLGDHIQFQIVLRHLKHYFPSVNFGFETTRPLDRAVVGLCNLHYRQGIPVYLKSYPIKKETDFRPCEETYADFPSTKPTRFLKELGVKPRAELFYYQIAGTPFGEESVSNWLDFEEIYEPFGLIHYEGKSCPEEKNLSKTQAGILCSVMDLLGVKPILIDSKVDLDILYALIDRAEILIGVDSGVEHVAGATNTPTLIFWRGHHPVKYFDLCDNITHLWLSDLKETVSEEAHTYFLNNYQNVEVEGDLTDWLLWFHQEIKEQDWDILSVPVGNN